MQLTESLERNKKTWTGLFTGIPVASNGISCAHLAASQELSAAANNIALAHEKGMVEAAARVQSGLEKGMVEAAICVAVAHVVATAMSIGPWCVLFVVMSIVFVGASAAASQELSAAANKIFFSP